MQTGPKVSPGPVAWGSRAKCFRFGGGAMVPTPKTPFGDTFNMAQNAVGFNPVPGSRGEQLRLSPNLLIS